MADDKEEEFRREKTLGEGAFGKVYLVSKSQDKYEKYAMKVMDLTTSKPEERKLALQEAEVLRKFSHPHVLHYITSFEKDGLLCIVTEYCPNGDLAGYLKAQQDKGSKLEEKQILTWFFQTAQALKYLHGLNALHRDLKCPNIFLDANYNVRLGDMGLTKILEKPNAKAVTFCGSPYYLSPEIFSCKPYDSKSDIWALGVIVYEMSTLERPFDAMLMHQLVSKIVHGSLPKMPEVYCKGLVDLIVAMLSKDPDNRPTAAQIVENAVFKNMKPTKDQQQQQSHEPLGKSGGAESKEEKVFGKEDMVEKVNQASASVPVRQYQYWRVPHTHALREGDAVRGSGVVHETNSSSDKFGQIVAKQLYLYLPFEPKEIHAKVFYGGIHKELIFDESTDVKGLWENEFSHGGSDSSIICEIKVKKKWKMFPPSHPLCGTYSLSGSVIQRLIWAGATTEEVATHMKHIVISCKGDVKSSCMQIEELGYIVAAKTLEEKVSIVTSIEYDPLCEEKDLVLAILIAKMANDENMEEFDKNILNLLSKLGKTVQWLYHVVCSDATTDLPPSSVKCLKKLSYWVLKNIHGDDFCLVLWKGKIPYLSVDDFFLRIHQNLNIIKKENKESVEIVMKFCSEIRDRIVREQCQNDQAMLLIMLKKLSLPVHMQIYMEVFSQYSETEMDVDRCVKKSLLSRIMGYTLMPTNINEIEKLKNMWKLVKEAKLGGEQQLILKFEGHVLDLWQTSSSWHHEDISPNWCGLCEDETLFAAGKNQTSLLNSMAKASEKAMHGYMLHLAQMEKFKPGISFYTVQSWLDTAINVHCKSGRPVDNLVSWYYSLGSALHLLESLKQKGELANSVYQKIKTCSLKASDLLKYERVTEISQKLGTDKKIISVIKEHAVRLLKEKHRSEIPENILSKLMDKSVREEWQADTVTTLLELFPPIGNSNQEKFMSLLSRHAFWKAIFNLKGKYLDRVLTHESFKSAQNLVRAMRESFTTFSVQVAFVEQLTSNSLEEKVAILFMTDSFPRDQFHSDFKQCKENLNMEKVNLDVTKSTIQSVLRFCPQAGDLFSRLDTINEELRAGQVLIKNLKKIWNPFQDLPKVCTKLKVPVKSKIFWKICKKNGIMKSTEQQTLKGESPSSDVDEGKNRDVSGTEDILSQSCKSSINFLHLLSEKGCDLYSKFWENLFQGIDVCLPAIQEIDGTDISKEIELIEEHEGRQLDATSKLALNNYVNVKTVENTVKAIMCSISTFNVKVEADEKLNNAIKAFQSLSKRDICSLSLFDVHSALMTVREASDTLLSEQAVAMLIALNSASSLISFLSEVVDEDLTNWIDAFEEVFETSVKESTVSGLIEVKRFLQPFLETNSKLRENPREFFNTFAEKLKPFKQLVGKVEDCMHNLHSLKSLYKNLANRSEGRREIIKNIVAHGSFNFSLESHQCVMTVTYGQENISKYTKISLIDLRSSALLLMHTARKDESVWEPEDRQEYLGNFVTYIDLSLEIAELCTRLHESGHIRFIEFKEQLEPKYLSDRMLNLKEELIAWQKDIKQCREQYYYMNFLNGNQIQSLYGYLTNHVENEKVVNTFLKFIHPLATVEGIRGYFLSVASETSQKSVLMNMGKALEHACQNLKPVRRPIDLFESAVRITESVQKGKLLIASLDENDSVVKAVLGLYQINSRVMPEAHQVLFCRYETSWDELELILRRCLGAPKFGWGDSLFCLANIEMLSNEKQFQLVDALRKLPKEGAFCLALIFRGPEHHPFLHEFSDCVTQIQPMTPASLEVCLHKKCPDVFTVTSHVPGLGKTEQIKRYANEINNKCITFHVSGPFRKQALVEQLSELTFNKGCVLHIDVGDTPSTKELDVFFFELLVLQYVSTCTASVFLTTDTVRIEIANTMNNTLSDALLTATSFKRQHLEWRGFETLQVSSEIHSPVQVVCHYLDALNNGTIGTRDIIFKGTKALEPLSPEKCRRLLEKNFSISKDEISYTIVNVFVQVLADQLKKLSCSGFFSISSLSIMVGRKSGESVKTDLVKAMIHLSKDFSARSIKTCRECQVTTFQAASFIDRVEGMIHWENSNHLLLLFHSQDIQTLTPLYREKSCVSEDVQALFQRQMNRTLPDYEKMSQDELGDILKKVTGSNPLVEPKKELHEMAKYYALTPDNLLKMAVIMQRVWAHIPVIVMGETGCGKTSLIHYLANMCDIKFKVMNIHAGLEETDIINRIQEVNSKALGLIKTKSQVWLFLDEINTSGHIALISDIICHHFCLGRMLAPNLVIIAACNPYKLRPRETIHTAGLKGKAKMDDLFRLVYRVHPLPETMVDYVWDFGSLSKKDEKMYIFQMVYEKLGFTHRTEEFLVNALVISQDFMRNVEKVTFCVSLRDVRRCKDLAVWFKDILNKKNDMNKSHSIDEVEIHAIVLALAHCYHSRLTDSKERKKYRDALCSSLENLGEKRYTEKNIKDIIRGEQEDILDRMKLPPGTAKNTALLENVFVILVCILNRIPIFVVGKPGCSKSLSMQVIRSNLRGPDSENEFFRTLPQLYCVSYQGSESSTSEGITKVFDKAQKYQEINSRENVQSVVILDEIGLAESSRFNPLKVLHSLLEPTVKLYPDVAVVGISNWALDASKMNRAIHLSRPEMDVDELFDTGESISNSLAKSTETTFSRMSESSKENCNIKEELKGIAKGYFEFVSIQKPENFYGLRDYYSLVKYFAKELIKMKDDEINQNEKGQILLEGILRNFGGQPSEMELIWKCFKKHIKVLSDLYGHQKVPVLNLIKENIEDRSTRHLLLITKGDSVLGILEKQLKDQHREHMTIFGSKFEEDLTDDYSYRILSRIILCMEQGLVLILKDLENVYGSLYDMLNQNYTVVGNKKNCRIALGPYSNPMCYVHDDFRCIVLVEEKELKISDPPFFNRFEKQCLQYSEILDDENKKVMSDLEHWIDSVTLIPGKHFSPEDTFPIYSRDMVLSLIMHISSSNHQTIPEKVNACKMTLLEIMKPESIVRLGTSKFGQNCSGEDMDRLKRSYFSLPIHDGLESFLQSEIGQDRDHVGKMMIVFTNRNIHTDLKKIVPDFACQIEKLSAFKSEKQLTTQLELFWQVSETNLLILQSKADSDGEHILLAKTIIEKFQTEYYRNKPMNKTKHVCLIIHLERHADKSSVVPQIDFLAKWKIVMLDMLEKPKTNLPELIQLNLLKTITGIKQEQLHEYIRQKLPTAFTSIRYGAFGRDIDNISRMISKIRSSLEFMSHLEDAILMYVEQFSSDTEDWQVSVACDTNKLYIASSFMDALETHVFSVIFNPLVMLLCELEKHNLLDSFFIDDSSKEKRQLMWSRFFRNRRMFSIDETPLPTGPECYLVSTPALELHMPFSKLFFERIEDERENLSELIKTTDMSEEIDNHEELDNVQNPKSHFSHKILEETVDLQYENCQMDYVHDFCTLVLAKHSPNNIGDEKINTMHWLLKKKSNIVGASLIEACQLVHSAYWANPDLIMNEFTLIETCRELVDLSNILPEIFTQIFPVKVEEGIDEQNSDKTHLNNMQCAEDTCSKENLSHLLKEENTSSEKEFTSHSSHWYNTQMSERSKQPDGAPSIENNLIAILCKRILPSREMFESEMGLEMWNRKVQNILSLAGRVSRNCIDLYGLRFCSDLTSIILIPSKLDSFWLVQFGDLLHKSNNVMDLEFTGKVSEMLISFDEGNVKKEDRQKIFCQFVIRYLQATKDGAGVIDWLLQMVERNQIPDNQLSYLKSPFHCALCLQINEDENESENIFVKIIDDDAPQLVDDNQFLSKLNNGMMNLFKDSKQDFALATLLVDIFEQDIFGSYLTDVEDVVTDSALERLKKAERIISEEAFSLRQLLGIAYYRKCVKIMAVALPKDDTGDHQSILQKLDTHLKSHKQDVELDKKLSLQLFFLKVLKAGHGFNSMKKKIKIIKDKYTFLSTVLKDYLQMDSADSLPIQLHNPGLHRAGIDSLKSFDDSRDNFRNLIKEAVKDGSKMLSLHSVCMQQFYLKRTVVEETDSSKKIAKEIETLCKESEMDVDNLRLIQCYLGLVDFQIGVLNLCLNSNESEIQFATLVTQLASLALSKLTHSSFYVKCVLKLKDVLTNFFPGMENEHVRHESPPLAIVKSILVGTCTNHHRFAISTHEEYQEQCEICSGQVLDLYRPLTKTFCFSGPGRNDTIPGRNLTAMSKGILQMITISLLTMSLALGLCEQDDIRDVLHVVEKDNIDTYLYKHIESTLRNLEVLTGLKQTELDYFLYILITRVQTLLWKDNLYFLKESERNDWEREFTKIVSISLQDTFSVVSHTKKQIMTLNGLDDSAVEYEVQEIDEIGWLPCLFRLTREPSLENLSFNLYERKKADSFPFVAVVLRKMLQLQFTKHIMPIISWHKACLMYLSYKKKKADCKKPDYTVSCYVHEEMEEKRQDALKKKICILQGGMGGNKGECSIG